MSGLSAEDAARHIVDLFGGEKEARDASGMTGEVLAVSGTSLGDFGIRFAPPDSPAEERPGATRALTRAAVEKLAAVSGPVSSCEVHCPPVPFREVDCLDRLLDELRRSGAARDREAAPLPLGFDLVVDAEDTGADTIASVIKSFCLISDWLRQDYAAPDIEEAIAFPEPYSLDYRTLVAEPGYQPDINRLAADYIRHNPTRNRELDLLPLFADIAAEALETEDTLPPIQPMRAYCYRLPRAGLARAGGIVADELQRWQMVESIAADPVRLGQMGEAFLARSHEFVEADWTDECEKWLPSHTPQAEQGNRGGRAS